MMKGWTVPRYDYKCEVCGSVQEITKDFGDNTVPVCCDASMTKIFSSTPIHFRGGGFYKTGG
jgi:putative FmdB family regulatory protein